MARSKIRPGDGDVRHGTINGYTNLCCRCRRCKDANAAKQRDYMLRTGRVWRSLEMIRNEAVFREMEKEQRREERKAQHGTRSKYTMGCRCKPCTKANRDYQRDYMYEVYRPKVRARA